MLRRVAHVQSCHFYHTKMEYGSVLGIDVASRKLDLHLTDSRQSRYEQIPYTPEALDGFIKKYPQVNAADCIVGMEATGDYQIRAARYFLAKGFTVKIINPLMTKHYTKTTIRGIKTDKKDAELISRLTQEGYGETANLAVLSSKRKEMLRLSGMLTHTAVRLKLRLQSLERKELEGTTAVKKKMTKMIKAIETFADQLVDDVTEVQPLDEQFIDSIPGFAVKLSAIVKEELGDIARFENPKSLVAFAGLDPRIKQSGSSLNTTGKLTKRGSPHLRAALFMAANVAYHHDTELQAYYEKKKAENRTHKEILCIISRKLLYRIYAVLKEKRPYVRR